MRTTISGATTAVLLHARNNSVLIKVRSGLPLYEIAGGMGISTAEASDLMEAELKNEKKKKELSDRQQIIDLHTQGIDNVEISQTVNVPVNFVLQTIAVYYSRKLMVEKPVSHFHSKEKELNPDALGSLSAQERSKRNEDVSKAYQCGLKVARVAEMYGLTAPMVYFILRKCGIKSQQRKQGIAERRIGEIDTELKNGKTVKEVAQLFDLNPQTVYMLLRQNGIGLKNRVTYNDGILKAFDEGLSIRAIAERLAISYAKVYTVLKSHNKICAHFASPNRQERFIKIKQLYEEGKTFIEIGEACNMNARYAWYLLDKKGLIKKRVRIREVNPRNVETRAEIVELFKSGTSIVLLAERYNRSKDYIMCVLRKHGYKFKDLEKADKMKMALLSGLSRAEVAAQFGVSQQRVRQVLKKAGIPIVPVLEQENQKIAQLFKSGIPINEIGDRTGIMPKGIFVNLARQGLLSSIGNRALKRKLVKDEYDNGLKDIATLANRYDLEIGLTERIITGKLPEEVELTNKRREIICNRWKEGKTVSEIMSELNLTRMAVWYHINQMPNGKLYKKQTGDLSCKNISPTDSQKC